MTGKDKLTDQQAMQLVAQVHDYGINIRTREIFLTGYMGDYDGDPGTDYRSSQVFLKNLYLLEMLGRSKITVRMQLTGGDWPAGMAIFDAIRAAKSHIVIVSYAQASSMSGVILQAGDERIMMPDTHFMLHHGYVGVDTTSMAASEAIKFNDHECERMLEIFAEKCIDGPYFKSRRWGTKKVAEYLDNEIRMRGDWFLPAEEAIVMGFADRIFGR